METGNALVTEQETLELELEVAAVEAPPVSNATKDLVSGTSALGAGVVIERAFGFLSNILAARLGGASTFGAYSLAISTAGNISTYAAGGIGSTATRFSGEYPRGTDGYPTLIRVLALVSAVSAAIAALIMWIGARPLAQLLEKPGLTGLLEWAALSGAGMILVECARGFFVGQKRLKALLLLSSSVGIGMLALLPVAAKAGPIAMICSQSGALLGAVGLCVFLYRPLGLTSPHPIRHAAPFKPILKQVWAFGFMQLAGMVGMNAAGWWLTSLVAKCDGSMTQMGFFAVAHQLRNMVALGPSLLTQASMAVMARRHDDAENTPENVMAMCSFVSTWIALALAGAGMIVVPWGLTLMYGKTYAGAELAAIIALATAVVHMGSAPFGARLWIVSIRAAGLVNTAWALFVGVAATVVLLHYGDAAKAAAIYFAAHFLMAVMQAFALKQRGCMPRGAMAALFGGVAGVLVLSGLAYFRELRPETSIAVSGMMAALLGIMLTALYTFGRRKHWIPPASAMAGAFMAAKLRLSAR